MRKIVIAFISSVMLISCGEEKPQAILMAEHVQTEEKAPNIQFGLDFDTYCVWSDEVENNDVLSDMLMPFQVSYQKIHDLVEISKDIFDTRRIKQGHGFHILCDPENTEKACYFIYEKTAETYIVYDLEDNVEVWEGKHDIETRIREVGGIINSSLYLTLRDQNVSAALAMEMADMYAWTIDFYRIQKGDYFRIVFEEKFIMGERVGVGNILAANFNHKEQDNYGFAFEQDSTTYFFDENGASLKRAFLKSPLKFSRISSKYSLRRKHPVTGRNKPHYGTDYAAPTGTPIMAVGDGTIIKSERKRNNGNYVKIKHNETYTTQYLHMSKRMVSVGDRVKQGDIIGLVGSTGLATGPHVCYRFWKNGRQVDHLKEDFIPSEPITEENKAAFETHKTIWKEKLDAIEIETAQEKDVSTLATILR